MRSLLGRQGAAQQSTPPRRDPASSGAAGAPSEIRQPMASCRRVRAADVSCRRCLLRVVIPGSRRRRSSRRIRSLHRWRAHHLCLSCLLWRPFRLRLSCLRSRVFRRCRWCRRWQAFRPRRPWRVFRRYRWRLLWRLSAGACRASGGGLSAGAGDTASPGRSTGRDDTAGAGHPAGAGRIGRGVHDTSALPPRRRACRSGTSTALPCRPSRPRRRSAGPARTEARGGQAVASPHFSSVRAPPNRKRRPRRCRRPSGGGA